MNAGHLRTSEFLANAALFQCAVLAYNPLEVDGSAHRRSGTTVGSKNDEALVNPCCREIDKRKQTVDLKVTGEVSSSGRMVSVGRPVAECRVWIESDLRL